MREYLILACAMLVGFVFAPSAHAAHWSPTVNVGASRTPAGAGYTGPVLLVDLVRYSESDWQVEPVLSVGVIGAQGSKTDRVNHDVGLVAAGVRITSPSSIFLQVQAAAIGPRTPALSTTGQIASSLGWQGSHWSIQLRHISNAGTGGENAGETMLLAGWRW